MTLVTIQISLSQYPTLADRLKFAMDLRGYSAQKLANRLFVSHSTISGYRLGYRTPDSSKLVLLARELRVSTDFLLGLTDYIIEDTIS